MWSLWGKLSRPNSLGAETSEPTHNTEIEVKPVIVVDYYKLRDIEEKLSKLKSVEMFTYPNQQVATTYEDVMDTLKGLLNVIEALKEQVERNAEKLSDYDRLKNLVSKHSEIVSELSDQSSKNLNRVYSERRQNQQKLNDEIAALRMNQQKHIQKIQDLQQRVLINSSQIQQMEQQLAQKSSRIAYLQQKLAHESRKLADLTRVEDSSIKFQVNMYQAEQTDIHKVLIYSKIRKNIYRFINASDFRNLSLVNKQIHYICSKTLKKQFIGLMMSNQKHIIASLQRQFKEYEKIYDNFPPENIRNNAIKYLFFKIKPGAYMLPYFQNDQETSEKTEEKPSSSSKLAQFSSFFKKKQETESKEKALTFESLKNDHDFKQIQKRVQIFFDKLFGIEAAVDLKVFNQTMKKQLSELKTSLKSMDKSMQLLCMSRYLYIEMSEMNNLLQVCFALLVHFHNDIKDHKKKSDDLRENDKVLRNLLDSIANDREQVEKRIFFLQNQNLKFKNTQQKLETEVVALKEQQVNHRKQYQALTTKFQQAQRKVEEQEECERKLLGGWEQIQSLLKEIPISQ